MNRNEDPPEHHHDDDRGHDVAQPQGRESGGGNGGGGPRGERGRPLNTAASSSSSSPSPWYECWSGVICQPGSQRIVRDTMNLSDQEQDRVYGDLGGAPETNREDSDFIFRTLAALHYAVEAIQPKTAFDRARQLNEHYTDNPGFRIMFLRANHYDVSNAATQIVAHFEAKAQLFGWGESLGRGITLNDLDEDDLECLRRGSFQVLPHSDHFRRPIVCSRYVTWRYSRRENILRVAWYMNMALSESEAAQRYGIVLLGYSVNSKPAEPVDFEVIRQLLRMQPFIPLRIGAFFFCFSDNVWQQVADLLIHLCQLMIRVRFRYIQGTNQECRYKLLAMGIPPDQIPVADDGTMLYGNHDKWIEERRNTETAFATSPLQIHLNNNLGRGAGVGDDGGIMDAVDHGDHAGPAQEEDHQQAEDASSA